MFRLSYILLELDDLFSINIYLGLQARVLNFVSELFVHKFSKTNSNIEIFFDLRKVYHNLLILRNWRNLGARAQGSDNEARAALNPVTQHAIPPEFRSKWGT